MISMIWNIAQYYRKMSQTTIILALPFHGSALWGCGKRCPLSLEAISKYYITWIEDVANGNETGFALLCFSVLEVYHPYFAKEYSNLLGLEAITNYCTMHVIEWLTTSAAAVPDVSSRRGCEPNSCCSSGNSQQDYEQMKNIYRYVVHIFFVHAWLLAKPWSCQR